MNTKLVPLRIPNGWAVIINHFGDEDPIVRNGTITNDLYYNEDLIWIQSLRFENQVWVTDAEGHTLGLGWFPESDPNGSYRLKLTRGHWSNVLLEFESTDRQKICAVIEKCLELITQGVDDEEIPRIISDE